MLHVIRTPVTNYYHDYDDDDDGGGHDDDEDDHDHDDDDDDGGHEVDKMRVLLMIFQWGAWFHCLNAKGLKTGGFPLHSLLQ